MWRIAYRHVMYLAPCRGGWLGGVLGGVLGGSADAEEKSEEKREGREVSYGQEDGGLQEMELMGGEE